jgi:uncharacterized delta-60 repeat protein
VAEIQFETPPQQTSVGQAANGVAVDTSGNIVAAGFVNSKPSLSATLASESAAVARLTPNGAPDANFGPSGQVIISTATATVSDSLFLYDGFPADYVQGIVEDSDGNILLNDADDNIRINNNRSDLVLVGSYEAVVDQTPASFSVVALSSSAGGQFTDAYGNDAVAAVSFSAFDPKDEGDFATAGLLQPNGTILVAGSSGATDDQIPLARFEVDGSLDTSFAPTGPQPGTELLDVPGETSNPNFAIDSSYFFGPTSAVAAMAFQSSSHILLADTASIGGQSEAMVVRLNTSNDTIDSSFGNNGVTLVPVPSGGTVSGVAVDPASDRIVVAGSNYLLGLTSRGQPDTTFGPSSNGIVSIADLTANALAVQSDGKIVVAGYSASDIAALERYNVDGSPDTTFGPSRTGFVTTDIDGSGTSAFYTVAIQPNNGEIVAAGTARDPTISSLVTVVARYVGETPEITGLDPSSAGVGGKSFTLTVTGDNFVSGSTIYWNGNALTPTQFNSATALSATVPVPDLAEAGTASITVVNPGGVQSNAEPFPVGEAPAITSLSPAAGTQGEGAFPLTVTGENFVTGSTISWNGIALTPTTYNSGTSLTATVPASDLTQAVPASITVVNPGGVASNAKTFMIGPPPSINSLSPASGTQGEAAFTLTVTGNNFVSSSTVDWNGSALPTTVQSTTTATATVPASDLTQAVPAGVTVVNPGGVASNAMTFTIGAPPSITSLSPASGTQGEAAFTLTVTGSNFVSSSTIDWNGSALPTTVQSATTATAPVSASDLTQAVPASVTVVNPGGVGSNPKTFTIGARPLITSLTPVSGTQGEEAFTLAVTGLNFVNSSTVDWNGSALPTTVQSATNVTASVPASDLTQAVRASVTVENPGGVASNTETFTIGPPPSITSLSPASGTPGEAGFTLTVTGNNFVSSSTVDWNGSALPTTVQSATTATASVPASDLTQAVPASVTVVNPGGVASNAKTFAIDVPPSISSLSPAWGTQGKGEFPLTVTGENFVSGSTIYWNGSALAPTTFNSTTSLTATVPASDLAHAGTASITVVNPGGVASSFQLFTIIGKGPPAVTGITIGSQAPSGLVVSIVVSYNEPMSIGSVQNPSLYTVLGAVTVKRKTKYSKNLGFRVNYNATAMTATLTLGAPYKGGVKVTAKRGIQAANGLSTEKPKQSMLM